MQQRHSTPMDKAHPRLNSSNNSHPRPAATATTTTTTTTTLPRRSSGRCRILLWFIVISFGVVVLVMMGAGLSVHQYPHDAHHNLMSLSSSSPESKSEPLPNNRPLRQPQQPRTTGKNQPTKNNDDDNPQDHRNQTRFRIDPPYDLPPIDSSTTTSSANDNDDNSTIQYHLIFSTGCSGFQDWQSYLMMFHVYRSGQRNARVTRIASGCSDDAAVELQQLFATTITNRLQVDAQNDHQNLQFRLHLTPDFGSIVKPHVNYKYFNKPYGTLHWLEHALGYEPAHLRQSHSHAPHDDTIVVLLDPDQILLRPFQNNDFAHESWRFLNKGEAPRTRIRHGQPMAAMYGFNLQWRDKVTMNHVVEDHADLPSPVSNYSNNDARKGFVVGPPYIATARDMYAIATYWAKFVPRVHDEYPHLLAEMFAYSLAAAHLELPHQVANSFMISSITSGLQESWARTVDSMPPADVCNSTISPHKERYQSQMPYVFHFCQRYTWGPYFFGKNRFPHDFLTCDSPLLAEPPFDLLTRYKAAYWPPTGPRKTEIPRDAQRHAFGACTMIHALNEAATYYKQHHCNGQPEGEEAGENNATTTNANLRHSLVFSSPPSDLGFYSSSETGSMPRYEVFGTSRRQPNKSKK
mmetsp:Transcript_3551/g.9794  ORF Transcript_3551/g.9794 Transcript_3551/m.9794 type:complete len:634 (+) Transcript_3551:92-1993(+)